MVGPFSFAAFETKPTSRLPSSVFLYIDLHHPTAHNPLLRLVLTLSGRQFRTFEMAIPNVEFRLVFLRSRLRVAW